MRRGQIIGISIALVAGLAAFFGMKGLINQPPPPVPQAEQDRTDQVEVLVASETIGLGKKVTAASFKWMKWPATAVQGSDFITHAQRPNVMSELAGSVARTTISRFEPITERKLIKPGKGGVLAAILPEGMRAVSTKISRYTAAGQLILPNDHVDVILTVRKRCANGNEQHMSTTLFRNIRVLAIGQQLETGNEKEAQSDVATLELTPDQAERLAQANAAGEISLALRSVADLATDKSDVPARRAASNSSIRLLRYGMPGRSYN